MSKSSLELYRVSNLAIEKKKFGWENYISVPAVFGKGGLGGWSRRSIYQDERRNRFFWFDYLVPTD